jgi:histidine triad (HIT) family protein
MVNGACQAPFRAEEGPEFMANDCLFCKIAQGEIPSTQVYSDDEICAFRDIQPAAPTHVLIIPRKHIARIDEATQEDAALLGHLLLRGNHIAAEEGLSARGFRYVFNCGQEGGQEVYHIHLHLIGGQALGWPPFPVRE